MSTFHVIFLTGMERYVKADYFMSIGENWDFYTSRNDTEVLQASYPAIEVETIVEVDE